MCSMTADVTTDVLVVGSGAAGMYAALAAARNNADTILVDKSLIGRGGALGDGHLYVLVIDGPAAVGAAVVVEDFVVVGGGCRRVTLGAVPVARPAVI